MVKKKKVDGWGLSQIICYELENDNDTVKNVFCKICRDFYTQKSTKPVSHTRGTVGMLTDKWVTGTTNIKKSSAIYQVSLAQDSHNCYGKVERKYGWGCEAITLTRVSSSDYINTKEPAWEDVSTSSL